MSYVHGQLDFRQSPQLVSPEPWRAHGHGKGWRGRIALADHHGNSSNSLDSGYDLGEDLGPVRTCDDDPPLDFDKADTTEFDAPVRSPLYSPHFPDAPAEGPSAYSLRGQSYHSELPSSNADPNGQSIDSVVGENWLVGSVLDIPWCLSPINGSGAFWHPDMDNFSLESRPVSPFGNGTHLVGGGSNVSNVSVVPPALPTPPNALESRKSRSCCKCHERFDTIIQLETHAKMADHKVFSCNIKDCDRVYARKDTLLRHQATTHRTGAQSFPCHVCKKHNKKALAFARRDHLRQHLKNVHRIDSGDSHRHMQPQIDHLSNVLSEILGADNAAVQLLRPANPKDAAQKALLAESLAKLALYSPDDAAKAELAECREIRWECPEPACRKDGPGASAPVSRRRPRSTKKA